MENKVYNHPYYGKINYLLHIDDTLMGKENLPLVVFLHGAGERGRDFDKIAVHGIPKYIKNGSFKDVPGIVVCPQCPDGFVWVNLAPMLKDFINSIIDEYKVDKSRVSITGISMGGYGTWEMLMFAPELFSKAAPICGGGTPWRASLIRAKVWAFHGDTDTVVPPKNSYEMVDAMKNAGLPAKLTIFHGVAHNSWEEAYEQSKVIEWLFNE